MKEAALLLFLMCPFLVVGQSEKVNVAVKDFDFGRIVQMASSGDVADRKWASVQLFVVGTWNNEFTNKDSVSALALLLSDLDSENSTMALAIVESNIDPLISHFESLSRKEFQDFETHLSKLASVLVPVESVEKLGEFELRNAVSALSYQSIFYKHLLGAKDLQRLDGFIASLAYRYVESEKAGATLLALSLARLIKTERFSGIRAVVYYKIINSQDQQVRSLAIRALGESTIRLENDFSDTDFLVFAFCWSQHLKVLEKLNSV